MITANLYKKGIKDRNVRVRESQLGREFLMLSIGTYKRVTDKTYKSLITDDFEVRIV